ncbi:MAG: hypothetical protein GY876_01405 [Planctomycetes bacterium]|nr:hypothetical protein [Planctomycetota bacterium]
MNTGMLGLVCALMLQVPSLAAPCEMNMDVPDSLGIESMFGNSVALDGNLLAVGAPLETGVAWATGAVYVFRLEDGRWVNEAKLIVDDANWGDMLGVDVDLQGDTIIAGAWFNDAYGSNSGAAYVFTRNTSGIWSEPEKLVPPDPGAEDVFGRTVALGDGFCAVGAPLDDDQGSSSGSIHVFDRGVDDSWVHAAKLVPPVPAEGHQLGLGLAADGLRIVGGSPWAYEGRGDIRLWQRFGSNWSSQWHMTMEFAGSPDDFFGFAVSLEGGRMAAGCYRDDTYGEDAGSVWVMDQVFDGWAFNRFGPADPQPNAQFGVSVTVSGDHLMVGSRYAPVNGVDSGRVDVFEVPSWNLANTLISPQPEPESEFGWACDMQGDIAIVGALYQPDHGAVFAWSGMSSPCGCQGDLDGDGEVGVNDILAVLEGWGGDGDGGDVNGDGSTGIDDLLLLIALWGPCSP